jgi:hypothetical protein
MERGAARGGGNGREGNDDSASVFLARKEEMANVAAPEERRSDERERGADDRLLHRERVTVLYAWSHSSAPSAASQLFLIHTPVQQDAVLSPH